jgi:Xaa-Pro aminopeptidase
MVSDRVKKVSKACDITVKILKELIKKLKKNKFETEIDVENFLKTRTEDLECKLAFPPIIASGKNGYNMHHKPSKSKLVKGFLVVDFGVKYKGYCSDCTRTFYIGKPSKKEKRLYNLVLDAQLTAINEVKPGIHASDLDAIARSHMQDYVKKFIHGLGHGVGKKIHQNPYLSPRSKSKLKKGQIITIEPGLYFKGKYGIRIEDTVLVKEKAYILTKLDKKLVTI